MADREELPLAGLRPDAHAPVRRLDSLSAVAERAAESLRRERRSTASRVSETLRDSIIRGELPPGTPLREQSLAQGLDVSRNTVREALRLLSHEGLVNYTIHRGVVVRQLSRADIHDIYRTREALELVAIDYSVAGEQAELEAIGSVVDDAARATAAEDWPHVATLDIEFHQLVVQLIGSEAIALFFRRVVAELRLAFAVIEPSEHGRYVPWNRLLADLLIAGEREPCKREMRAYLADAEQMILRALERRSLANDERHPF